MKILVTDTLADSGLAILRAASDMEVDYRPGLKGEALLAAVRESDALITRSGTAVTEELVNAGTRLRIIGRAGVGLDNVDVDACTARGILVINAPTANIMSATEHTMAMLLALCRNIPEAHASVKRGDWNRSKFMGTELDGKTLGIIGLGRIGTRITARARAFGMRVIAYDPYIAPSAFEKVGAERVSLDDLLARADVITVHTPLTDETRGMIGAAEMAKMKEGVVVLNIAAAGSTTNNRSPMRSTAARSPAPPSTSMSKSRRKTTRCSRRRTSSSRRTLARTRSRRRTGWPCRPRRWSSKRCAARSSSPRSTCRSKASPTPTPRRSSTWLKSSASSPPRSSAAQSPAQPSSCGASTNI